MRAVRLVLHAEGGGEGAAVGEAGRHREDGVEAAEDGGHDEHLPGFCSGRGGAQRYLSISRLTFRAQREDKTHHSGRCAPPSISHLADARVDGEVGEVDAERGQQEVVLAGLALLAADALDGLDLAQALGGGGDGCEMKIVVWCDVGRSPSDATTTITTGRQPHNTQPLSTLARRPHLPAAGAGWP